MNSWPRPFLPAVAGHGEPLRLFDTARAEVVPVAEGDPVLLYVCGITPYDATHLGHAATYVTFDLSLRTLLDAGRAVRYVQNVTDVDDPLLERAERDGIDWRDLAAREIALFHDDMTALAVVPPDEYIGVVESIPTIAAAVVDLLERGAAYRLPAPGGGSDVYLDLGSVEDFGLVSGWSREQMMAVFADRGGDPDREGKHDPLDPLLWRAHRDGEPSWTVDGLDAGRPGWHIECTAISLDRLGDTLHIQGGGSDLVFPHHEMSGVQGEALTGAPFAQLYVHQGMVAYEGEKMSKSRGNLVLVSRLRASGVDPMAIRLVLLAHHYRCDWEYHDDALAAAQERLDTWRRALSGQIAEPAEPVVAEIRAALADDLDAPRALRAVDDWAARTLAASGDAVDGDHDGGSGRDVVDGPENLGVLARALDALLGVRL